MKKASLLFIPIVLFIFSCTKDTGTITMTYTKATAQYGDLDELRNTPLIAPARGIDNAGKIFVGTNVLLIGEEGLGIHVYDNTNPSNPTNTLFIDLPFNKEFFVKDDIIYAESHYDMVKIDISDPSSPLLMDRLEFALASSITDNSGRTLVGFIFEEATESFELNSPEIDQIQEIGHLYYSYSEQLIPPSAVPVSFAGSGENTVGTVNRISVHQGHVYVISNSKLSTFEDTPSGLTDQGAIYAWGSMETIYAEGTNLFIGTRNSMMIYDISDPNNPQYTSDFWHATSCDPVYPCGDIAYSTLRTGDLSNCPGDVNELLVLDISVLTSPLLVQQIEMESPYGMTMIDDQLYVGEGEFGLKVFDASEKSNLQLVHSDASIPAYDIIPHPVINDLILTAGPDGINQYEYDQGTFDLTLISTIDY